MNTIATPQWVAADTLAGIREVAEANGIVIAPHLARLGIDPELVAGGRGVVPFASLCQLLEQVAADADCPDFGFRLGKGQRPLQFGIISQLLLLASDVGEAIRIFLKFRPLYSQASYWALHVEGSVAHLRRYSNDEVEAGPQLAMYTITRGIEALRSLIDTEWRPIGIYFSHDGTSGATAMRRHFGAPLFFNSLHDEIAFARSDLDKPLPTANPQLLASLTGYFEELLPPSDRVGSCSKMTSKLLRTRIGEQNCTQGAIANALAMHPRTLQRALAREGTSFRQLLDDARLATANHLLSASRLPVSEIATLVGYQHSSSFARAFAKQSGTTATSARQRSKLAD